MFCKNPRTLYEHCTNICIKNRLTVIYQIIRHISKYLMDGIINIITMIMVKRGKDHETDQKHGTYPMYILCLPIYIKLILY